MSILAQELLNSTQVQWIILGAWMLASAGLIVYLRLFKPTDFLLKTQENASDVVVLGAAAIVGLMLWILVPTVYLMTQKRLNDDAGTAIGPRDYVVISVGAPLIAWMALIIMLELARPKMLLELGLGFKKLLRGVPWGIFGLFLAMPFVVGCLYLSQALWKWIHFDHPEKHQLLEIMEKSASQVWILVAIHVAAIVCAPLFEELFFRGIIQTTIRKVTNYPAVAVLVSSIVFTAIHPVWTWPPIFVLALFLGVTYEKTRSLWATTIMHALFNTTAIVLQ